MRARLVLVVVTVVAALAGCGGGDAPQGADLDALPPPADGEVDEASAFPADCGDPPLAVPDGAVTRPVADLDGDGAEETLWIVTPDVHRYQVGISLSTGEGPVLEWPIGSSSTGSALVVDVDGDGRHEVLFDRGDRTAILAFEDCTTHTVTGPDGQPLTIDRDGDPHTGVDCADLPEGTRLVALATGETTGPQVRWSQAVVHIEGTSGALRTPTTGTYRRPQDDSAIARLTTVGCGDVTVETDGVSIAAP